MTNIGYKIALRNLNNYAQVVLLDVVDGEEFILAIGTGSGAVAIQAANKIPTSLLKKVEAVPENLPICILEAYLPY